MKGYSLDDIVKMSNIKTPKRILNGEKKNFGVQQLLMQRRRVTGL